MNHYPKKWVEEPAVAKYGAARSTTAPAPTHSLRRLTDGTPGATTRAAQNLHARNLIAPFSWPAAAAVASEAYVALFPALTNDIIITNLRPSK